MCRHTKSWQRLILSRTRQRTSTQQATVRCRCVRERSNEQRCCGTQGTTWHPRMLDILQEFKVLSNEKSAIRSQMCDMKEQLEKLWKGLLLHLHGQNDSCLPFQFSPMFITNTPTRLGRLIVLHLLRCSECDQATKERFWRADESVNGFE